jgi:hypothetical protein
MSLYTKSLVTVICESIIEDQVVELAKSKGLRGYTISDARGEGQRGTQSGELDFDKNIKMEFLTSEEHAIVFMEALHNQLSEDYALITYKSTVEVLRNAKFI